MKSAYHTAFSIILSGILLALFKSWGLAIASLISGIFIDLDHIMDYLVEYGHHLNIKKFFRACYETQFRRLFLLLHGWEWLIFWGAAAKLTDFNPWITGFLIGYGQHLVLDQLSNKPSARGYFLSWRWKNGFDPKAIFPWHNSASKDIKLTAKILDNLNRKNQK